MEEATETTSNVGTGSHESQRFIRATAAGVAVVALSTAAGAKTGYCLGGAKGALIGGLCGFAAGLPVGACVVNKSDGKTSGL